MIAQEMKCRDVSVRRIAAQLDVDESTLRYRLKRSLDAADGACSQTAGSWVYLHTPSRVPFSIADVFRFQSPLTRRADTKAPGLQPLCRQRAMAVGRFSASPFLGRGCCATWI